MELSYIVDPSKRQAQKVNPLCNSAGELSLGLKEQPIPGGDISPSAANPVVLLSTKNLVSVFQPRMHIL